MNAPVGNPIICCWNLILKIILAHLAPALILSNAAKNHQRNRSTTRCVATPLTTKKAGLSAGKVKRRIIVNLTQALRKWDKSCAVDLNGKASWSSSGNMVQLLSILSSQWEGNAHKELIGIRTESVIQIWGQELCRGRTRVRFPISRQGCGKTDSWHPAANWYVDSSANMFAGPDDNVISRTKSSFFGFSLQCVAKA